MAHPSLHSDMDRSPLEVALDLAARGAFVFPCHSSGAQKKRPQGGFRWSITSTNEPARIREYWTRFPDALIALDLGKMGLYVIDPDRHGAGDGVQAWMDLCDSHGWSDAQCPRVSTASMGEHIYFRNTTPPLGNVRIVPGLIDSRGAGGYVIAPGSKLIGEPGDWRLMAGDIFNAPPIPDWLIKTINRPKSVDEIPAQKYEARAPNNDARVEAYVSQAIEAEARTVAQTLEGGRNNALNAAAFSLGQLVGGGLITEADVRAVLMPAAHANGLIRDDGLNSVIASIRSGIRGGIQKPRGLPEQERAEIVFAPRQVITLGDDIIDAETGEIIEGKSRGIIRDMGEDAEYVHPEELVRDTIPATGVGFLAGQSGAYKTFLAVELSFCLMTGADFAGRMVERTGPVLFAAFEGSGTIAGRVKARRSRCPDPNAHLPFYTLENFGSVSQDKDFEQFKLDILIANSRAKREHGSPLVAIIIDTVAASGMIGEDKENDPAAWQKIFSHLNPLSVQIGAPIILIHHYGKNAEAGLRGSSNARAGADFVLAMTCERNEITGETENHFLALTKSRTAPEGSISAVSAEPVRVGERRDGSPVFSLVLNFDTEQKLTSSKNLEKNKGGRPRSQGQELLDRAFNEALIDFGRDVHIDDDGAAPFVRAVEVRHIRAKFFKLYVSGEDDPDERTNAARMAFKRCLERSSDGIIKRSWGGTDWAWKLE